MRVDEILDVDEDGAAESIHEGSPRTVTRSGTGRAIMHRLRPHFGCRIVKQRLITAIHSEKLTDRQQILQTAYVTNAAARCYMSDAVRRPRPRPGHPERPARYDAVLAAVQRRGRTSWRRRRRRGGAGARPPAGLSSAWLSEVCAAGGGMLDPDTVVNAVQPGRGAAGLRRRGGGGRRGGRRPRRGRVRGRAAARPSRRAGAGDGLLRLQQVAVAAAHARRRGLSSGWRCWTGTSTTATAPRPSSGRSRTCCTCRCTSTGGGSSRAPARPPRQGGDGAGARR